MFRDCARIITNVRLQLAILLILAVFDVIMTMVGLSMGFAEQNPLWGRLGEDMYIFRIITTAFFVGFFGLVETRYPDGVLYRACRKALVIGLVIIGLIVTLNIFQILWQ